MRYNIAVVGCAFEPDHLDQLRAAAERCGCAIGFYPDHRAALPYLGDKHIIFGPSDAVSPEAIRCAPNLRWFASYYAGVDPLMKAGVLPEGVLLTNGSGAYGITIAEHMVMVCLMLLRRQMEYTQFVRERQFRSDLMVGSIYGARIAVCGTGDIGTEFARRVRAFSPAEVIGLNRTGRENPAFDAVYSMDHLEEVLPNVDILAMCLPGTPGTDDLMSRERIGMLKPSSILINVGRGNCLDQDALIDALNEKKLAGAALDVFRTEPIPVDDPAWDTPGLLVTPHCSGKMTMRHTREVLVDTFCENLRQFCGGEALLHTVDRELGY